MIIIAGGVIAIIVFMIIVKTFKNKSKRNKICDLAYFYDGISPFDYINFCRSNSQTSIQKKTTWAKKYAFKESFWTGFISEIWERYDEICVNITVYYKESKGYKNLRAYYSFSIDLHLPKSQKEQLLFFHKGDGVRFKFKFSGDKGLFAQKLEKIGVKEFEFKRFLEGDD